MALSRPLSRPLSRMLSRPLAGGVYDTKLLESYGGAAAAYSLQDISGTAGNVVRARRSTDNTEANFTANGVKYGALRHFALNNDSDLIRFANQAAAADKRMYFDGSNDYVSVSGMTATTDYFGACTISAEILVQDTSTAQAVWSLGLNSYRLAISAGSWFVNNTFTGSPVSTGLQSVSVQYDASGQATSLSVNGSEIWSGIGGAVSSDTVFAVGGRVSSGTPSFLFKGIIYDFSLSGSAVKNFSFNGYGNTNGDWEDQVGSNNGTVNGSPALFSGQGFNAYVTTLYDQSGNGRNATQATAASQPQIVADGVVVTDANGNPSMDFDGTDDYLRSSSFTSNLENIAFFNVAQEDVEVDNAGIFALTPPSGSDFADNRSLVHNTSISTISDGVSAAGDLAVSRNGSGPKPYSLASFIKSAATASIYINGSIGTTDSSFTPLSTSTTNTVLLGARFLTSAISSPYLNGKITEVICYQISQSSNRAAIEANIAARYGITLA